MRAPSVLAAAGLLFFKFCRKRLNDREQGKQYQANLKAWDRYSKDHPEKFLDRQDLLTDFFTVMLQSSNPNSFSEGPL